MCTKEKAIFLASSLQMKNVPYLFKYKNTLIIRQTPNN